MTQTPDATAESAADANALHGDPPASRLRAVVVEYERRPNRCTVCPREMTVDQLTTAWLTADAAAFYDLAEIR